jgi:hypothetical protein
MVFIESLKNIKQIQQASGNASTTSNDAIGFLLHKEFTASIKPAYV